MSIILNIHRAIGDFRLDIHFKTDSKRIGILGASGCGKSMTLKCIAGIENPDYGLIKLDDRVLYDSEHKINPKPQKRNVGYLFQNYALFPTMTVRENIGIGVKKNKTEKKKIVDHLIEKFQLTGLEHHLPMELSGGQQQRVALARIMAYEPDAILLDEPFSALDMYLKERLQHELLEMLEEYKGTVIMVSHSRDEIFRFSEDLLMIDEGQTVIYGDRKRLFENPEYISAARLTGCKNIVPIVRKDSHTIWIPEWELTLEMSRPIDKEYTHIGIRAHEFIPQWEKSSKNCLKIQSFSMDELPFERKYYIRTHQHQNEEICWFVGNDLWKKIDELGMPGSLFLPENKLLFLK